MLKGVAPIEMQLVSHSQTEFRMANNQQIPIWLAREIILRASTQYDYKNTMIDPKIHCKSKNTITAIIMHSRVVNAPINIMPHYPPPGQCRGKGGAFNLF